MGAPTGSVFDHRTNLPVHKVRGGNANDVWPYQDLAVEPSPDDVSIDVTLGRSDFLVRGVDVLAEKTASPSDQRS
jgi:hypothetical protein